jgi:hypothetical protein
MAEPSNLARPVVSGGEASIPTRYCGRLANNGMTSPRPICRRIITLPLAATPGT